MNNSTRNIFGDILKGIGIAAIVVGHAPTYYIGGFVYSFHLMIFAFTAGYLYNPDHAYHPIRSIVKKVKKQYILFMTYEIIFIMLHNPLISIGIIPGELYDISKTIRIIGKALLFQNNEELLRPFWFVPWYLATTIVFEISQYLSKKTRDQNQFNILCLVLSTIIGITVYLVKLWMPYRLQVAILALPIVFLGAICRVKTNELKDNIPRYVTWGGGYCLQR